MYDGTLSDQKLHCGESQDSLKTARMFAFSMITGIMMWPLIIWVAFF